MQVQSTHDIFISYSVKDKEAAESICAALERAGLRCWIAPRDVLPGINWGAAILSAINSSRAMVLVFSSHANQSPHVLREVERAVSHSIPIIPLRLENVPPADALEFFISVPHWLDAITPPLESHMDKLVQTLQRLLSISQPTPAAAAVATPPPIPTMSRTRSRWILALVFGVIFIFVGLIVLVTMLVVRHNRQLVLHNQPATPAPATTQSAATQPHQPKLNLSPIPNLPINWPNLTEPTGNDDQTENWTELRSQAGHFHILMPGRPRMEHSSLNTEIGVVDMYYWGSDQAPYSFAVVYADYPPSAVKDRDPQQLLANARDGAIANVGGKLTSDENIYLGDYPGREVRVSIQNGEKISIARFYMVRNRMFSLVCITDRQHDFSPTIDKFLNSFTLDQ